MILNAALSALANLVVLAALPFGVYLVYHKWRSGRSLGEVAGRAGLRLGEARYIWLCAAVSLALVALFVLWPPPLEPFTREGSAQREFVGLGFGVRAIVAALLYGVIETGFSEELLFRGLIAGSLSRRLPLVWANLAQALIFLLPHLLLLFVMPEAWPVLLVVVAGALFAGWVRIESGSIAGPWLLHAAANVTMALSVSIRTTM